MLFLLLVSEGFNESRLSILTSVCKKLKISTNFTLDIPFRVEPKKFYTDTVSQDIFKACNIILSNVERRTIKINVI